MVLWRWMSIAALLALPGNVGAEERARSKLSSVQVETTEQEVIVKLAGSRAPDFTSFTMNDPFRVVVDWAGSELGDLAAERRFDRGLVRRWSTRQFDSEAEQISRVTIELARQSAYHVRADGHQVTILFKAVPEPIQPSEPVATEPEAPPPAPYVPEGPLTEPVAAVPSNPPALVLPPVTPSKKEAPPVVAVAPKIEAPRPAPMPAPVAPPAPVVAKVEPRPAPVLPQPKPYVAEGPLTEPAEFVAPVVAKVEPPKVEPPKVAPAKVEPPQVEAPKPAVLAQFEPAQAAPEPVKLASWSPEPATATKKEVPAPVVALAAPKPVAPKAKPVEEPARFAAAVPHASWQPPGVGKEAIGQETVEPTRTVPADPEQPVLEAAPPKQVPGAAAEDFDPGPRVMKYIGFQQMAEVSRVFVRLDGKARYRVIEGGNKLVLELLSTSINVKNNERPLDTSYFDSPVTRVQAVRDGDITRVEVALREDAPAQVKRIGTTIAVDFTRRR